MSKPKSGFDYADYFGQILPLAEVTREQESRCWRPSSGELAAPYEYILYLGCNVMRTVNLAESIVAVLNAMGVRFVSMGGPRNCCGIVHHMNGDFEISADMTGSTLARFEEMAPKAVLLYCPSCHFHMDSVLPGNFEFSVPYQHVTRFLAESTGEMKLVHPVERRVALHFHPHNPQQEEDAANVQRILEAIPGLAVERVPTGAGWGRHCTPQVQAEVGADGYRSMIRELFAGARERNCDAVATVYHSCYRELCGYEAVHGLEVLNYIELVCQGMGLPVFEPRFKRLRMEADPQAAFSRLQETAERRNVSPKLVERSLQSHFGRGIK